MVSIQFLKENLFEKVDKDGRFYCLTDACEYLLPLVEIGIEQNKSITVHDFFAMCFWLTDKSVSYKRMMKLYLQEMNTLIDTYEELQGYGQYSEDTPERFITIKSYLIGIEMYYDHTAPTTKKRSFDEIKAQFEFEIQWENIRKAMQATNWHYATGTNEFGQILLTVPTVEQLKEKAFGLLQEAYTDKVSISGGGFSVGWATPRYMYLSFELESTTISSYKEDMEDPF
jgi:hypothetical protein